jgi:uncharacterized coiled-coil DUF342 family protein
MRTFANLVYNVPDLDALQKQLDDLEAEVDQMADQASCGHSVDLGHIFEALEKQAKLRDKYDEAVRTLGKFMQHAGEA